MARPRVFVSSTYYDLKHIRSSLETFVSSLGYEPILFENGDIPFHHEKSLDESCYDAVEHAHIFVLIIGGRYGSSASGQMKLPTKANQLTDNELDKQYKFYNSVTVEEYRRARSKDIPIYIFLEKGVAAEYQTYKENKGVKIKYAHVDNVSVFHLLDDIFSESRNNLVREFETFSQISTWLRDQWAGLMADFLSHKKTDSALIDLTTQVETLNQVVDALKSYSEVIVKKVEPDKSADLIRQIEQKLAHEVVERNPLIRFIRRYINLPAGADDVPAIIDAVIHSGSLEELTNKLAIDEEFKKRLLSKSQSAATRDFKIMRKKLFELTTYESEFKHAPPVDQEIVESSHLKADHLVEIRPESMVQTIEIRPNRTLRKKKLSGVLAKAAATSTKK